jgi:superfamily II DNA or RNA helicase
MARAESKMIMGYLPIEERHYPALLSLVAPATPAVRMLDPFAGEGAFLDTAAKAWNVTPYANELDGGRAAACIVRFGPTQAVRCDVERLVASNNVFGILWANPPYDHDKAARDSKRIEFAYLRHAWKWAQDGALVLWCVYHQHITEEAAAFFAKHSQSADVWALPGKHLGEYDQVVVIAVKGEQPEPGALYQRILAQKAEPHPLMIQPEPLYKAPPPRTIQRFVFAPDLIDAEQGLRLIEEQGAWKSNAFQALLEPPAPAPPIEPVVPPRPGHLALVLAAGVADGAVIDTDEYGCGALRGKTRYVEEIARVEVERDPNDPERQVKTTTMRLKPTTTLTLLTNEGTVVEMEGDEALLGFISANKRALVSYLNDRFQPMYQFNFDGMRHWLDRIKLKGKYALYTAQKHVIAATTRGLRSRDSILLVGQMGTGKTAMGGTAAIAVAAGVVKSMQDAMRPDQVVLIVAPPHLVEKWKRELYSIHSNIVVERLDRHEDVKAFMDKAARLGAGIAKIGLIKRDMTKLGSGHEPAVVWRNDAVALWQPGQPTPHGYEPRQRIQRERLPKCPHCGCTIMVEKKGTLYPASESWLKSGRRSCSVCQTPLWQEARDPSSKPKPGYQSPGCKQPKKNPRYRLDEYLKRRYHDRVYLLIWDEVHEAQHGDTGNGEAFSRMAGMAKKVLAMTGTPFNGRSSSIFNIEYALNPRVRQRYAWGGSPRLSRKIRGSSEHQVIAEDNSMQRGRAESRWVADMGVREQAVEERPTYDRETGAYTGTSTYERPYEEAPGISPLLIAEVLDHSIFFSLGDLGKWLPKYEEIAVPVALDADIDAEYDRTKKRLKDYLIERRWQGDTSFRGAYLQWSMGWLNATFRPYEVIHNLKHPITGEKLPYTVVSIPSYGEDRVYAKEQALIDLVKAELAENRPCVVYLRQTATRDIQPRIEALLRHHVPGAKTFILSNRVDAERREAVIEREIVNGVNVVLCNPELVKTGLDLIYFPTLIFYEIVFNLSTMMQSAGRSYRLNQTHPHCKVYYLFAEGTMEQTAVQLMSRKQRAAKLLTGDIGLTGLDALTEGEGGFEEALLDAIGRDEALVDPSQLFKADAQMTEIDADDAAYWNVETEASEPETEVMAADPLLTFAERAFDAVVTPVRDVIPISPIEDSEDMERLSRVLASYLDGVCILADEDQMMALEASLCVTLMNGASDEQVSGLCDPEFAQSLAHEQALVRWVSEWLKQQRIVFPGCEDEAAAKIVFLAKAALNRASLPMSATPLAKASSPKPQPEVHPNNIIDLTQRPEFERLAERQSDVDAAPLRQLALF